MAIRIKARHNEGVGQMLRRFKKLCEKEGLTKDVKRRQYFEKPSERKRRAERKAAARAIRLVMIASGAFDSRGGGRGGNDNKRPGFGNRSGPGSRSGGGGGPRRSY